MINSGLRYQCSFRAMIEDWRAKWAEGTDGATNPDLPFGWAQLNSCSNTGVASNYQSPVKNVPSEDDPLSAWNSLTAGCQETGFCGVRWAQTSALALPNTFEAVTLDTPVASGSIHSPFKQPVGARLARGALSTAYGQRHTLSPVVASVTKHHNYMGQEGAATIVVTVGGLGPNPPWPLEIRNHLGFEVLTKDGVWQSTPIKSSEGVALTLDAANATDGLALRYLWYTTPCGVQPYRCTVYAQVPALRGLSGELSFLPLGPFIVQLPPNGSGSATRTVPRTSDE